MNNSNSSSGTPQLAEEKGQSEVITPLKKDDYNIQYGSVAPTADDAPLIESDSKNQNKCVKICRFLCKLTIEPVMFCYMLAFAMNLSCMSKMMMDKGCLYHLNYSEEICNNLSEYKTEKENVEVLAANYTLYSNCMSLIGALFMIFIAPWSDKYGRKLPFLLAVFGSLATDAGFILCSMYFELKIEYLLLSRLPSEIFGGFICVLTIIYSHASEVSSKRFRTLKYALVEAAFGLGLALGGLIGGILYQYYGYVYIYVNAAALHVFCFLWIFFIVEETTGLDTNVGKCKKIKDFFVCQNMKEGVKTTFRRREKNERSLILLLIVSICVIVLTYESFANISYVFVHNIYDWDPTTFNNVTTTFSMIQMPLTIFLVPILIRRFKINDFTFGVIGTTSMMAKMFIISFAKYSTFIYYFGCTAGSISGLSTLAIRSGVSKLVEKEELGRVFSFFATCEATIPILGTIVVTNLFTATIAITPNIAYLASSVSLLLPLLTFAWAVKCTRGKPYSLVIPNSDHIQEKA